MLTSRSYLPPWVRSPETSLASGDPGKHCLQTLLVYTLLPQALKCVKLTNLYCLPSIFDINCSSKICGSGLKTIIPNKKLIKHQWNNHRWSGLFNNCNENWTNYCQKLVSKLFTISTFWLFFNKTRFAGTVGETSLSMMNILHNGVLGELSFHHLFWILRKKIKIGLNFHVRGIKHMLATYKMCLSQRLFLMYHWDVVAYRCVKCFLSCL